MKYTFSLLLFTGILFASCGDQSSEEKTSGTPNENPQQETDSDTSDVEPDKKWNYYAGVVGLYSEDVVVELSVENNTISGGYWYLKHGKRLELNGEISPKQNEWKITESYNGKTTGSFQLEERNDSLIGIWYAPKAGSEPQKVALRKLVSETEDRIDLDFETYQLKHDIDMYNWETEEFDTEEGTDEMRLVHIGDYVLFSYDVIGSNAHMGFINGVAKMKKSGNEAVFTGESDCELTIRFKDNAVIAEESDCQYYRGMRAYFGGQLERVK